ncbi:hypothetical protein Leryth_024553 [Lithospermum erythrorhizon]|nr:hypothetical protein Leryth_024553 [Lithospermum erythrorhizon]
MPRFGGLTITPFHSPDLWIIKIESFFLIRTPKLWDAMNLEFSIENCDVPLLGSILGEGIKVHRNYMTSYEVMMLKWKITSTTFLMRNKMRGDPY